MRENPIHKGRSMRNSTIFLIACCLIGLAARAPAEEKPNIVLIMADDMR
jgi:hypothetical protein